MNLQVLIKDQRGNVAIDPVALMDASIDLVFKTTSPDELDVSNVTEALSLAHDRLFKIATNLVSRAREIEPETKTENPAETIRSERADLAGPLSEVTENVPSKTIADTLLGSSTASRDLAHRAELRRRRSDYIRPSASALPRRIKRKEDALRMDSIICLEDGKAVQHLGQHLEKLGMSQSDYLKKWKLPDTYPMQAPSLAQKRGVSYEYDLINNVLIQI